MFGVFCSHGTGLHPGFVANHCQNFVESRFSHFLVAVLSAVRNHPNGCEHIITGRDTNIAALIHSAGVPLDQTRRHTVPEFQAHKPDKMIYNIHVLFIHSLSGVFPDNTSASAPPLHSPNSSKRHLHRHQYVPCTCILVGAPCRVHFHRHGSADEEKWVRHCRPAPRTF